MHARRPKRPPPLNMEKAATVNRCAQPPVIAQDITIHCLSANIPESVPEDVLKRSREIESQQRYLIASREMHCHSSRRKRRETQNNEKDSQSSSGHSSEFEDCSESQAPLRAPPPPPHEPPNTKENNEVLAMNPNTPLSANNQGQVQVLVPPPPPPVQPVNGSRGAGQVPRAQPLTPVAQNPEEANKKTKDETPPLRKSASPDTDKARPLSGQSIAARRGVRPVRLDMDAIRRGPDTCSRPYTASPPNSGCKRQRTAAPYTATYTSRVDPDEYRTATPDSLPKEKDKTGSVPATQSVAPPGPSASSGAPPTGTGPSASGHQAANVPQYPYARGQPAMHSGQPMQFHHFVPFTPFAVGGMPPFNGAQNSPEKKQRFLAICSELWDLLKE